MYCNNLRIIEFRGTKAQWNAIEFGEGWDSLAGDNRITDVVCTDGVVSL